MPEQDERTTGTPDDATGTTELEDRDDAASVDGSDDSADGDADGAAGGSDSEQASSRDRELAKRLGRQLHETQQRLKALEEAQQRPQASATAMPSGRDPGVDQDQIRQFQSDLRLEAEINAGVEPTVDHFRAKARLDAARTQILQQQLMETRRTVELVTLPEDIRKDVDKLMREEGVSRAIAERLVRLERAASQNTRNADAGNERERDRKTAERLLRDSGPELTRRSVPSGEAKRLSDEEYLARLGKLNPADPEQFEERRRLVERRRAGKL